MPGPENLPDREESCTRIPLRSYNACGLQGEAVDTMQEESSSSEDMQCKQCRRPFTAEDRITSISGSIMGDESTDCYFLCPVCNVYTVVSWWDNFTGVETVRSSGPLSKHEGDAQVALIAQCSEPWNKKCRCAAHCTYFRGTLD